MQRLTSGLFLLLIVLPAPLFACSLCPTFSRNQDTLGEEMDRAKLVLYGRAMKSVLETNPGAVAGSGRTEFQIDRVLKDDPFLTNKKALELARYIPVLDPRDPPRFLLFCDVFQGKLDPYLGRPVKSEAMVAYLEGAKAVRTGNRIEALLYYFRYLDHADEAIAGDAFREFAKAGDQEVAQVTRHLAPEKLRALLQNPRTTPEFLGLLAYLLGGCGGERDAVFLRNLIARDNEATRKALDGLLAGYIALKPREGWDLVRSYTADTKKQFLDRYAAVCAMRFSYKLHPKENRQEALRCLEPMVRDGEVADMAIEDLRAWKLWDLTGLVLAQHGKTSHATPITRRAIVRYALCCPLPEARLFIDRVRAQEGDLVREIEAGLQFEK